MPVLLAVYDARDRHQILLHVFFYVRDHSRRRRDLLAQCGSGLLRGPALRHRDDALGQHVCLQLCNLGLVEAMFRQLVPADRGQKPFCLSCLRRCVPYVLPVEPCWSHVASSLLSHRIKPFPYHICTLLSLLSYSFAAAFRHLLSLCSFANLFNFLCLCLLYGLLVQ